MLNFSLEQNLWGLGKFLGSFASVAFYLLITTIVLFFRQHLLSSIETYWKLYLSATLIVIYSTTQGRKLLIKFLPYPYEYLVIGFTSGFTTVSQTVGNVLNTILLVVTYFIALTPIAFLMRVRNRKLLNLKPNKSKESYWQTSQMGLENKDTYYRQF